jgi:RimJ/RimL family protein N-acetyltransferase
MACSRSKEPIPYEQHLDWLARFEANPDQAVYLLVLPGMHRLRIGYGHIKAVSEWACEISYILSEQACGLGIGRWLVREICREAKETFLYREISATVGIHNWASRKILERNGFALKDAGQEYAIYHKGL